MVSSSAPAAASAVVPAAAARLPALFICHGGGPLPILGEPSQLSAVQEWKRLASELYSGPNKPSAIVVVSAHYETSTTVGVGGAAQPGMLYDYYGFPPESYSLKYPAPGNPDLAARIAEMMTSAGISAELDEKLPFDHGVFVPLMLMFPDADIPVVPVSVLRSQKASEHIAIGRAIASLRDERVLILGSGTSAHNFAFLGRGEDVGREFNDFLTKVVEDKDYTAEERAQACEPYLSFPGAHEAQVKGQAEHLMPLFTVMGTAGGNMAGREVSNIMMMTWNERHYVFDQ